MTRESNPHQNAFKMEFHDKDPTAKQLLGAQFLVYFVGARILCEG
jgi:hypothetical protein